MSNELIHVVTGLTPEAYRALDDCVRKDGKLEPRMHGHPLLGLWHAHGPTVEAARTPHTHRPVVGWDTTPVPIDEVKGPERA